MDKPALTRDEYDQALAAAQLACVNQPENGLIVTAAMIIRLVYILSGADLDDILTTVEKIVEGPGIWDDLPTQ